MEMEIPEISPFKKGSSHIPWEVSSPVKEEAIYFESPPSYEEFFEKIFLKNQLCVLGPCCTASWPSRKLWVSNQGTPDFEFLSHHFGQAEAPVANCYAEEFSCHPKTEMTVSDFVSYWQKYQMAGHPSDDPCLYLKDWHFTRDFPWSHAYSPPGLLCSDWLNEFWDVRQDGGKGDDYRFVYMGPKNTWTPFHSDVLRSYSWSANICGRKKWIFVAPGGEDNLRDQFGQLLYDVRDPSLKDGVKYPQGEAVVARAIEVIQKPGEIVFVPSGWHHQVFNLEDTISINHNWINGASAHLTWAFLKSQLSKVKSEIADCSDMDGFDSQCQKILKADSGMDYVEFYNFIATIAQLRIWALEAFNHYCDEEDETLNTNDNGGTSPTNGKRNKADHLCLWKTALYHFESLRERNGYKIAHLNDMVVSVTNRESWSSGTTSAENFCATTQGKSQSQGHTDCPHWAHCGYHLAVFDLRQTRSILVDVIGQLEWSSLMVEKETMCLLLYEHEPLLASIERTINNSEGAAV